MTGTDISNSGGAVGFAGRLDIRVMLRSYLPYFKAAEPWSEALDHALRVIDREGQVVEMFPWKRPAKPEEAISKALAIRAAIGPREILAEAQNTLEDALEPPREEIIRAILIGMLKAMRSKPTEGADIYIDTLVFELAEPETDDPISAPAIVAAARETWNTQTFAPSVHEFMPVARKHQKRINAVLKQLDWLAVTYQRATEVLRELAPEKLPKRPPPSEDEDWDDF
jgi:hypothetical protein